MSEAKKALREKRVERIKSKSGIIVSIFTMFLALNTYINGNFSSTVLNNTIKANDIWAFYQAKSIKQTILDVAADNVTDTKLHNKYAELANRYESDKKTGEGKRELMEKAREIEAERDLASHRSSWLSLAGSLMQVSLLLISAATVAASYFLFAGSIVTMVGAVVLMTEGIWLWF
jgi:hypothetical protein